jgi:predicted Zn-dependent protease
MEPNAFALPGGFIFLSRGLVAQANTEDELACVIGHEIVHSERRHAAQQQQVARAQGPLGLPRSRAATLAAYGRDMEREADALGQRLCAAAGYDPMGMSSFLRGLDQRERLLTGRKRVPTFFDTHPGSRERAAAASMLARELRWTRDQSLGDTRARLLDRIDGMVIGDRPETGIFIGNRFVHPGLGFEIQFPKGWTVQNSNSAVGAIAPRGQAVVYLTADIPPGDLEEAADSFAEKTSSETGIKLTSKRRVRMGDIDAIRYGFQGGGMGRSVTARVTFFPFANSIWRIVGVAPSAAANRYMGPILLTSRSFGLVDPSELEAMKIQRLRVVLSREGEDIIHLGDRTSNAWNPAQTALLNGLLGNYVFDGGELVKVVRLEGLGNLRASTASP